MPRRPAQRPQKTSAIATSAFDFSGVPQASGRGVYSSAAAKMPSPRAAGGSYFESIKLLKAAAAAQEKEASGSPMMVYGSRSRSSQADRPKSASVRTPGGLTNRHQVAALRWSALLSAGDREAKAAARLSATSGATAASPKATTMQVKSLMRSEGSAPPKTRPERPLSAAQRKERIVSAITRRPASAASVSSPRDATARFFRAPRQPDHRPREGRFILNTGGLSDDEGIYDDDADEVNSNGDEDTLERFFNPVVGRTIPTSPRSRPTSAAGVGRTSRPVSAKSKPMFPAEGADRHDAAAVTQVPCAKLTTPRPEEEAVDKPTSAPSYVLPLPRRDPVNSLGQLQESQEPPVITNSAHLRQGLIPAPPLVPGAVVINQGRSTAAAAQQAPRRVYPGPYASGSVPVVPVGSVAQSRPVFRYVH